MRVLEIVAPVFLLAVVGFAWVKLGFEYRIRFVTQVAMTVSLPCLIFTALMKSNVEASALTNIFVASLAAYLAVTGVTWVLVATAGLDRQTFLAPLIFGNTGNIGLPIALFAFGEAGLDYAVVVFAVSIILSFTLGIWLVAGRGSLASVMREPIVASAILGAVFLWMGWETPLFLTNTLDLIGQLAIPLMLLTLGVAIARLQPGSIARAVWLSLAKFAICAGLAWMIGRWFDLAPEAFAILVLQVATPVAVTSYLLAERYGAEAESVAGLVVVSTLLSVATLPLILWLVI